MKSIKKVLLLQIFLVLFTNSSFACSACGALSNITQTINGSNLELTFTSNAGWECCYTVEIEIVCANANFSGIPNNFSPEICINGGNAGATTAGSFPYPLTVIDISNLCPGNYKWRGTETGCGIYTPVYTFTVAGLSPIVVNASLSEDTICINDNTQLAANASNGCNNGTFSYSWTPSGGLNNANIANPVATPSSTTTYQVTVTENGSCTAPQTASLTVTVNPLPTVNAGNDQTICENETVTLTGSGANTYIWNNGVSNGVSFSPPVGTTTYIVTGTDVNDCIDTDQVNVIVNPNPTVSFLPDATIGCVPFTVNFTNTTPNASNCAWTISNGAVLTGCDTVTTTFTQVGCYDITLTTISTEGCTSTFTAANLVCVENDPIASFTASRYFINEYDTIILFDNNSTGASNYVWDFGDESPTVTTENPLHVYSVSGFGNHLVTLIAYSPLGCDDTAYVTIQIHEDLIFYIPNTFTPDGDMFNQTFQPVFTSGFDPFDYTLLIFNRWGEIIFESHNAEIGWDCTYGKEYVHDGVYTWKIEFKTNQTDERKMFVGHVNVIR